MTASSPTRLIDLGEVPDFDYAPFSKSLLPKRGGTLIPFTPLLQPPIETKRPCDSPKPVPPPRKTVVRTPPVQVPPPQTRSRNLHLPAVQAPPAPPGDPAPNDQCPDCGEWRYTVRPRGLRCGKCSGKVTKARFRTPAALAREAEFAKLYRSGVDATKIAKDNGLSVQRVCQILAKVLPSDEMREISRQHSHRGSSAARPRRREQITKPRSVDRRRDFRDQVLRLTSGEVELATEAEASAFLDGWRRSTKHFLEVRL